jgi:hypothetical protein
VVPWKNNSTYAPGDASAWPTSQAFLAASEKMQILESSNAPNEPNHNILALQQLLTQSSYHSSNI